MIKCYKLSLRIFYRRINYINIYVYNKIVNFLKEFIMPKKFKSNPKISKKFEDTLNYMLNNYCRVLQTRIDLM
jgi:hypothetical protein